MDRNEELVQDVEDLKQALQEYDNNGKYAKCGIWEVNTGGYDLWWQVCENGTPVIECYASGEFENGSEIGNLERYNSETSLEKRDAIIEIIASQYDNVRTSPNEPFSAKEIVANESQQNKAPFDDLTELVAAGDWQINPERIDGFFKYKNFVGRQKLGSVYYGNDAYEFFGSIDASLRIVYFINSEPPVSFQLQHYTEAPNLDILRKLPPSGANGLSRQNYCEQFTSQIQTINDATVLSDTEELKKWLINKVLDDRNSWLSFDNLDAYKDIKEHGNGYFRQLDKEIAEYPDKLSGKRKLSVEEFDMLRNYYLSKIDQRNITKESSDFILRQMVKDGFDNERINIICKYANNGQGIGLPPEGYSNASLDKIREDVFKKPVIEKIK